MNPCPLSNTIAFKSKTNTLESLVASVPKGIDHCLSFSEKTVCFSILQSFSIAKINKKGGPIKKVTGIPAMASRSLFDFLHVRWKCFGRLSSVNSVHDWSGLHVLTTQSQTKFRPTQFYNDDMDKNEWELDERKGVV